MARSSKRELELAHQQFIGYRHAQSGGSVESLAEGMGLSASEWALVRDSAALSDRDKQALDHYFAKAR